jgi:hypothetical protein
VGLINWGVFKFFKFFSLVLEFKVFADEVMPEDDSIRGQDTHAVELVEGVTSDKRFTNCYIQYMFQPRS